MDIKKTTEEKAKDVFDALIGAAILIGGTYVIAKDIGGALKKPVIGEPPAPMGNAYWASIVMYIIGIPLFPLPLFVSAAFIGVQLIKHKRYNAAVKRLELEKAAEVKNEC